MHYLVIGFLVMLGAMAAVASAPMIFAAAIVAAKGLLILLLIGVVAGRCGSRGCLVQAPLAESASRKTWLQPDPRQDTKRVRQLTKPPSARTMSLGCGAYRSLEPWKR